MNKVRGRTSSRSPGLRLLFVGIALTLVNIWVFLKWAYLGRPRRGGRDVRAELFPLTMFKQFLIEALKATYGVVQSVSLPRMTSAEAGARVFPSTDSGSCIPLSDDDTGFLGWFIFEEGTVYTFCSFLNSSSLHIAYFVLRRA